MIKWLLTLLLALVVLSLLTPWLRRHGLGRLPGDVQLHWRGRQWQLPIASTLLLSAAATLLGRLF
jgi:hypothetical protein